MSVRNCWRSRSDWTTYKNRSTLTGSRCCWFCCCCCLLGVCVVGEEMNRLRIVGNLAAPCLTVGCHIFVLLLLRIRKVGPLVLVLAVLFFVFLFVLFFISLFLFCFCVVFFFCC